MKRNQRIREAAQRQRIKLWRIGEKLGLSDANFSRMLRRELSESKKNQLLGIIADIKREEVEVGGVSDDS